MASNLTSSFLNLAFANLDKFASRAKFGKLLKFKLPFLNFINLTAEVFSKFYKLRKHTESNFISKIQKLCPCRKSGKPIVSNLILMMSNWRLATKTSISIQTLFQGNPKRYPVAFWTITTQSRGFRRLRQLCERLHCLKRLCWC